MQGDIDDLLVYSSDENDIAVLEEPQLSRISAGTQTIISSAKLFVENKMKMSSFHIGTRIS